MSLLPETDARRHEEERVARELRAQLARDRGAAIERMIAAIGDGAASGVARWVAARELAGALDERDLPRVTPLLGGGDEVARGAVQELFVALGRRAFGERGRAPVAPFDRDALADAVVPWLDAASAAARFVAVCCLREFVVGGPLRTRALATMRALADERASPVRALAARTLPGSVIADATREAVLAECLDAPHVLERITALEGLHARDASAHALWPRVAAMVGRDPDERVRAVAASRAVGLYVESLRAVAVEGLTAERPPLRWAVEHAPDGDLAASCARRWGELPGAALVVRVATGWASPAELVRAASAAVRHAARMSAQEPEAVEAALADADRRASAAPAAPTRLRTLRHYQLAAVTNTAPRPTREALLAGACELTRGIAHAAGVDLEAAEAAVSRAACVCWGAAAAQAPSADAALAAVVAVERELADVVRAALPLPPLARAPG